MKKPQNRVPKSFALSVVDDKWLHKTAKRLGVSRSVVLELCIDAGRNELTMLDMMGMKPERLSALHRMWGNLTSELFGLVESGKVKVA